MRELLCALSGFVFCFLLTKLWLWMSPKLSAFQAIREEGPAEHKTAKQHVPTMGGIAILLAVILATASMWNARLWVLLGTFLACGLIGLSDDLLKVKGGKNLGLKARHKLFWQIVAGVLLGFALQKTGAPTVLNVLYLGVWNPGWLYIPLVAFVLIAASNAVNLTDGLDGLAAGTVACIAFFFFLVCLFTNPDPSPGFFSAALLGALAAFLWFNAYPAKLFMGDVGSLALGGALAALAFQTNLVFWLPIAGGVLVAETLSVILQVIYFKATGGKRIFKMSPLHHHYELSGVPETQVTMRFWIVSAVLCWVCLLGAIQGY